jgi:hypothetical protein
VGEGVLEMSSVKLNISQDQILEPPSFEIRSKGMFIWGGIVSYPTKIKQTKLELRSHTLCFANVRKKLNQMKVHMQN